MSKEEFNGLDVNFPSTVVRLFQIYRHSLDGEYLELHIGKDGVGLNKEFPIQAKLWTPDKTYDDRDIKKADIYASGQCLGEVLDSIIKKMEERKYDE